MDAKPDSVARRAGMYRSAGSAAAAYAALVVVLAPAACGAGAANDPFADVDFGALSRTHDLSLPAWGPYTKDYIGVSHVPDPASGLRFDLSVFPGYYRRATFVPNVFFESGFHPWRASPDLGYFEFRHDIEWKDEVYADISYSRYGEDARIVAIDLVNDTDREQSLALHLAASMTFPSIAPYRPDTPLQKATPVLPGDGTWVDALSYAELEYAMPRPDDDLVYDGWRRGEIRAQGFVDGSGVGHGFGREAGDRLAYRFHLPTAIQDAAVVLRYRTTEANSTELVTGGSAASRVTLPAADELRTLVIPAGPLRSGEQLLEFRSLGGAPVELDGFAIVTRDAANSLQFDVHRWNPVPRIDPGPVDDSLILTYADSDARYGLRWYFDSARVREIFNGELTGFYEQIANDHVKSRFDGDGQGHYTNVHLRPVNLEPDSRRRIHAVVTAGTYDGVVERLRGAPSDATELDSMIETARATLPELAATTSGNRYRFAVEKLAATLMTNIVYPVYTQRQYIRHSAPGRWWDSLYTWDSGFIGIGLLELDALRSLENLNAYLTSSDSQSAFIHHGTPLPVQHYQFQELWNRSQSTGLLQYAYPKLKRYYEFLAGAESSTTADFESGLLKTWDYFYNSGGWDDLPPQKFIHDHQLADRAAPVVTTAHVIRIGKILRHAARSLGLTGDVRSYDRDIAELGAALQEHSWDPSAGYFSYVMHDAAGEATGHLRTASGENLNKTLDGASPLVAGATTREQRRMLLDSLKDRRRLLSPIGLTAVDQSAGYYRDDGYWNGTVWMPHQWFIWKSLLDIGEHAFARQIALTALELWKRETEASYGSFEHFVIETGRGAGWHQFGALSAPVLAWYGAYFTPGRLTVGLDGWIEDRIIADDLSALTADISFDRREAIDARTVLATLDESREYRATWQGRPVPVIAYGAGSIAIQVPAGEASGRLQIRAVGDDAPPAGERQESARQPLRPAAPCAPSRRRSPPAPRR